jgi:5-methylcytosine-specific restriction endonuclease McrA
MSKIKRIKPKNDLTGQKFGKRLVLSFNKYDKGRRIFWNVKCDCGREFTCLPQDLKRLGPCRNCSPGLKAERPFRRKRPFEAQYNAWTKRAKYKVEISYEQFVGLTKIKECHYCGDVIIWLDYRKCNRRSNASNLDRKENSVGYTLENVVVCCVRCNLSKNNHFTYEQWKQLGEVIKNWKRKDMCSDSIIIAGDKNESSTSERPANASSNRHP